MKKEENVVNYYVLCNKLKNIVRTGWKIWNVDRNRLESVAEHIYGTQMLALAMASEFDYDIDLKKVMMMLAVHELEEIIIGDIPMGCKEHAEKEAAGHLAVKEVLKGLINKEEIEKLVFEFDEGKTKEAKFAYHCDKLECDLQEKLYDEEGCIDIFNQPNNDRIDNDWVQELMKGGAMTSSELWYYADEKLYQDDENFQKVFTFARYHEISK
ncbi:MAG: HD domain-containing protein [Bacilli bacterium]|nr:HD domain-containing protein [Bacilli bacterium]